MKREFVFVLLMFISTFLMAQEKKVEITGQVTPLRLLVGSKLTTNLIFPYRITAIDKGSKELLVQKAAGTDNVIQVKAGKENFNQTNLTVITSDGQLYSFLVGYESSPTALNIRVGLASNSNLDSSEVLFTSQEDAEANQLSTARAVAEKADEMHRRKDRRLGVSMRLAGIFMKDNLYYWKIKLENMSSVDYDIGQLRFSLRDRVKSKRTASQEVELIPVRLHGNSDVVISQANQTIVAVLPKTPLSDDKYLYVQLTEATGGRDLAIRINNKQLMKAVKL